MKVRLDENGILTLPDEMIEDLRWGVGDDLELVVEDSRIIIRKIDGDQEDRLKTYEHGESHDPEAS